MAVDHGRLVIEPTLRPRYSLDELLAQCDASAEFSAEDRASVDAFFEAATSAGGQDNGAPGVRAHYHENYYAAFVHDADGNNIEAVCHRPE